MPRVAMSIGYLVGTARLLAETLTAVTCLIAIAIVAAGGVIG
ncbi:hypothetical protein [Aliihoeflea sp. 2WW]|nr:hypothetical protein [Aliihoeflea sp. 2WW]